jgi:Flp pilus assembly protein TadG
MKTLKNKERGQSLVELSVSLLVLLYLLSGAVEFGIAFFQFVQLRDAAQEGALYSSMITSPDKAQATIENRVRGASSSPIDLSIPCGSQGVCVTVTSKDTSGTSQPISSACEGDSITVEVLYNHQVFMPFMTRIIGPTVPLRATVTDTVLTPPQTTAGC